MLTAIVISGLVLGVVGLVLGCWALFGDRSRAPRCRKCWYSMEGIGLTCPECGWTAKHPRVLTRRRRRWWVVISVGVVFLSMGGGSWLLVRGKAHGWWAIVPTEALVRLLHRDAGQALVGEIESRDIEGAPERLRRQLLRRSALLVTTDPAPMEEERLRQLIARLAIDDQAMASEVALDMLRSDDSIEQYAALRTLLEVGLEWTMHRRIGYQHRHQFWQQSMGMDMSVLRFRPPGPRMVFPIVDRSRLHPDVAGEVRDAVVSGSVAITPLEALPILTEIRPFPGDAIADVLEASLQTSPDDSVLIRNFVFGQAVNAWPDGGGAFLEMQLQGDDAQTRVDAALIASELGSEAARCIDELEILRRDPDYDVRAAASIALSRIQSALQNHDEARR